MKFNISHLLMLAAIVALAVGWWLERTNAVTGVPIPKDVPHSAIESRLGRPDAISGSGRSFLHYDLENGDRITIVVSGNEILGVDFSPDNK